MEIDWYNRRILYCICLKGQGTKINILSKDCYKPLYGDDVLVFYDQILSLQLVRKCSSEFVENVPKYAGNKIVLINMISC